jgi:small subunit ribosomal protein S3
MIEREFVKQKKKEFQIEEFVGDNLSNVGHSGTRMQRTPLGEKIIVSASRPGLVVGREGKNIKRLTNSLKNKFKLENPQIEINEIEDISLDANIVAEKIASSLERFGITKFKGVGHKVMQEVMDAGARGIEIIISGKVPSSRAKRWRFYQGYLKKCGDIALEGVRKAYKIARIKAGIVGIQVRIMPAETKLPDEIKLMSEIQEEDVEEEKETEEKKEEKATEGKKEEKKENKEELVEKEEETPETQKSETKKSPEEAEEVK